MLQRTAKAIMPHLDQLAQLRQLGCTEGQIQRFQVYRALYRSGYFQFDPAEYHRLRFARWLYLQGKLSG